MSRRAARGVEGGAGGRPRVSACVVARDAERTLERCLASLAFADERVVIVDERSCDATESIAISASKPTSWGGSSSLKKVDG